MARVEIATQSWGVVQDSNGNGVSGVPFVLLSLSGRSVTVYAAQTGSTTATLVTSGSGVMPGYVEPGTYNITLTVNGVAVPHRVEAVSGATSGSYSVRSEGALGDGTTDDSAAIQAALTAGAGGTVLLPASPTPYIIGTTVNVPSNTSFIGEGPGRSVLKASATLVGGVVQNSDPVNGNTDIVVENIEVDGNKVARAANSITSGEAIRIVITGGTAGKTNLRCHVRRCFVHDMPTLGIQFASVQEFSIMNNLVKDNGRDGITCYYDCQRGTIEGNEVKEVGDDCIGLNAENGTTTGHTMRDIAVTGNVLSHGPLTGQGVGIACSGLQDSAITGNVIRAGFSAGISVQQWNTTPAQNLEISNNEISNAGQYSGLTTEGSGIQITGGRSNYSQAGTSGVHGIHVFGNVVIDPHVYGARVTCNAGGASSDVRIEDNDFLFTTPKQSWVQTTSRGVTASTADAAFTGLGIANNRVLNAPDRGMLIGGGITNYSNVTIERNRVRNSGQSATATGIQVAGCTNVTCDGNHCNDTQGSPTQGYGIEFLAPLGYLTVRNNTAKGNVNTPAIYLNATDSAALTSLQIGGNMGWSPMPWHGVGTTATAAWNAQVIGAATVYYKDVAIVFAPAFPTGVTPALNVTVKDRTGYSVVPITVTNLGFTARVFAPGDPGSTTNANFSYIAEAP